MYTERQTPRQLVLDTRSNYMGQVPDSPSYKAMILTQKQQYYNNVPARSMDGGTHRPKSTESKYNYCKLNQYADKKMVGSAGMFTIRNGEEMRKV
jgi:hypothetical protein